MRGVSPLRCFQGSYCFTVLLSFPQRGLSHVVKVVHWSGHFEEENVASGFVPCNPIWAPYHLLPGFSC